MTSSSITLLTEHPLSEERLKNIFKNTRDLDYLCFYLNIPDDKSNVAGAVESYSMSGDPMKVRKMIFLLDEIGDTSLAHSVMDCAESPAGIFCMYRVHVRCMSQWYRVILFHDRPRPTHMISP